MRNTPLRAFAKKSPIRAEEPEIRALTEEEKKVTAGTAPGGIGAVYEGLRALGQAHTDLHKKSEGVREATKQTKPWAMGSMK